LELSEPCFWWWTVRSLENLENLQASIQFNLIQCRGFITWICEESIPFADTVERTSGELGMKLDTSMEAVGVKNWMSELGSVSWLLKPGTSATIAWWQGLGLSLVSQLFCMLIIAQNCTRHWNCWLLFAEKYLKPVMGWDMMDSESECEIVQQWLLQSSTEKVPKWLSNRWTSWRRTKQCSLTPWIQRQSGLPNSPIEQSESPIFLSRTLILEGSWQSWWQDNLLFHIRKEKKPLTMKISSVLLLEPEDISSSCNCIQYKLI
jgi:hypothetical protein